MELHLVVQYSEHNNTIQYNKKLSCTLKANKMFYSVLKLSMIYNVEIMSFEGTFKTGSIGNVVEVMR